VVEQEARPLRLLVLLGKGGHTTEMLHLVDLLGEDYDYHYLLMAEDEQSEAKIRRWGPIHRVPGPRFIPGKKFHPLWDPLRTLRCLLAAIPLLLRVRPDAILSTGPWMAVPVGLVARLLGIGIIFVETGSRVTRLSGTGRAMYHLADLFFVQWEELLPEAPRAVYAGRLW